MPVEELRYDKMVEEALRGVVRTALAHAAENGLPGDHHFYVTFKTQFPGVALADHLKARHPEEMTIVLQHQFWDLTVDDDNLSVTLSFSGKSERLIIPLESISGFADPSAKFGLQFQAVPPDDEYGYEDMEEEDQAPPAPAAAPSPDSPEGDGKVVTLDRFRKK